MSKFIKLSVVIMSICLAAACCGCGPPLYQIYFDQLFYDDQDVLVLGYRATENNSDDITKFAKFNTDTYKWEKSTISAGVGGQTFEKITLSNGAALFKQPFPSISDIQSQTDILLPNPQVYYEYFKSGKNYRWDRKTIIANVGINKEVTGDYYDFTKIHSFLFEYDEINSLWNIRHLRELAPKSSLYHGGTDHSSNSAVSNISSISRQKLFVDSNISLCQSWVGKDTFEGIYDASIKCLVKYDDGEVSLQKLYGEIMPAEYSGTIKKIYDSNAKDFPRVYFDKNQNLYAFYNNTDEAKGKYFYFEMYKPDNPTVAQHKQKIYWD